MERDSRRDPQAGAKADEADGRQATKEEAAAPTHHTDWSIPSEIVVTADFSQTDGVLEDLYGITRSPITVTVRCRDDRNPYVDLTPIYEKIGATSIRMNNDGLAVSQLFSRMPGTSTWGFHFAGGAERDFSIFDFMGFHGQSFCDPRYHEDAYSAQDEWLYWFPHEGCEGDDTNYIVAAPQTLWGQEVQEAFDVSAGFGPMYVKLGVDHFGARYIGRSAWTEVSPPWATRGVVRRFARAAARGIQLLIDNSSTGASPTFLELWGEPDSKYKGPYYGRDDSGGLQYQQWGQDFAEMYHELVDACRPLGVQMGGCGFTRSAWAAFIDTVEGLEPGEDLPEGGRSDRLFELLQASSKEYWDVFSVHRYTMGDELLERFDDETPIVRPERPRSFDEITDNLLVFPGEILRLRQALDRFMCRRSKAGGHPLSEWGWDRSTPIPLHVTEWNMALQQRNAEFIDAYRRVHGIDPDVFGTSNLSESFWGAAFVSAVLTWLQEPCLGVERAYYWAGRSESNCMVRTPRRSEWYGSGESDPGREDWVTVYPPAYSFSLHSDLAGRHRVPVYIRPSSSPKFVAVDALGAAENNCRITALAATTQLSGLEIHTIVVTNIHHSDIAKQHTVELRLSGLVPGETYQLRARRVEDDHGGANFTQNDGRMTITFDETVRQGIDPDDWTNQHRVEPYASDRLDNIWANLEDTVHFPTSTVAGAETILTVVFEYCGAVRLDFMRSAELEGAPDVPPSV